MNSVSFSIPQSRPAGFSASIVVTLVSALLLFIGFVALPYSATQRAVEIPVTLTLQIMPVLLSLATALFALRAWRSPAYASVDLGLAFGIGVLVLAAYHIRTLSLDAGPTLGDSFSRTGLGFWVSLVGALGLIGQRWLPRPEVDLLAKRNAVGKTWQRVFSGVAPGRAPFRLEVAQRVAPTANANSYYGATIDLSGQAPRAGAAQACRNPSNLLM